MRVGFLFYKRAMACYWLLLAGRPSAAPILGISGFTLSKGRLLMRRPLWLVAVVMLCCALGPGCGGDTFESLADSGVATLKQLVAVFDTIKDEASAKSAKPKLKSLFEEMNRLNERQAKLPEPTEAQVEAVGKKHGKEMEELQMKLASHMMRISFDPKIRAELSDLDETMRKAAK